MISEGTWKHFSTIACRSCSFCWDDEAEACLSRARSSKRKLSSVNSHRTFWASSTGTVGKWLDGGGQGVIWSSSKASAKMALACSCWRSKFGSQLCSRSPSRRKSRHCWPDKGDAKLSAEKTCNMQPGQNTFHVAKNFVWHASLQLLSGKGVFIQWWQEFSARLSKWSERLAGILESTKDGD